MTNNDHALRPTLEALNQFHPKSVFLYGSRGRGDSKPDSDYELGVVFDDDKYVQQAEVREAIAEPNVKAYNFKWDELRQGTFSWLFQKSLFMREVVLGGKTVAGENLLPQIQPLPITTLDLVQDVRFSVARALDALLSFRNDDIQTSMELFTKSCFYALRDLEILQLKTFPLGYDQIYELSSQLNMEQEYRDVVEAAHILRETGKPVAIDVLYSNVPLLDTFVEPQVLAAFTARGNEQLL